MGVDCWFEGYEGGVGFDGGGDFGVDFELGVGGGGGGEVGLVGRCW